MGNIRKVLSAETTTPRYITPDAIWVDLCEDVHLHYRNLRLDMSENEWAEFKAAIHNLGMGAEQSAEEYRYVEGDPNFLISIQYKHRLKSDTDYYPNRVVIELQRDNTAHFHYRDLRIHMSEGEFLQIANMFKQALEEYKTIEEFPYKNVEKAMRVTVPIDSIQPYDAGHLPLEPDRWSDHTSGIRHAKELIKAGKKIRPILVAPNGNRLDGFKRYMAFKELGYKEIEVIIDPFGEMGGQSNQSMLDD
jgi:hypothetical protein